MMLVKELQAISVLLSLLPVSYDFVDEIELNCSLANSLPFNVFLLLHHVYQFVYTVSEKCLVNYSHIFVD